jgi:hypothetical protein
MSNSPKFWQLVRNNQHLSRDTVSRVHWAPTKGGQALMTLASLAGALVPPL